MVKKGYSLAETLIVIALIMIMAGLFMNSETPRRKLTIQREAYILSQNIRTMENNAGNARSHTNCNIPIASGENRSPNPEGGLYPFDGYAIMLNQKKDGQYVLYTNCHNNGFPSLGASWPLDLSDSAAVYGTFLYNPLSSPIVATNNTEVCNPTTDHPCDYYDDERGGVGYINELLAIRKFPSSIKIKEKGLKAYIKDNNGIWVWDDSCEHLIIDFKPTSPTTYILCGKNITGSQYEYFSAREAIITITDGENERSVIINKSGLVSAKSDTQ